MTWRWKSSEELVVATQANPRARWYPTARLAPKERGQGVRLVAIGPGSGRADPWRTSCSAAPAASTWTTSTTCWRCSSPARGSGSGRPCRAALRADPRVTEREDRRTRRMPSAVGFRKKSMAEADGCSLTSSRHTHFHPEGLHGHEAGRQERQKEVHEESREEGDQDGGRAEGCPQARGEGCRTEGRSPRGPQGRAQGWPQGREEEARRQGGRAEGERPEGRCTEGNPEGRSTEGRSTEGRSTEGRSTEGRSTEGRSTEGRSTEAGARKAGARKAGARKAGARKAGARKAGARKAGARKAGAAKKGVMGRAVGGARSVITKARGGVSHLLGREEQGKVPPPPAPRPAAPTVPRPPSTVPPGPAVPPRPPSMGGGVGGGGLP